MIVDDHKLVRQGLRFLLEQEPGFEVVGECADGSTVLETARGERADVVLLDLLMPRSDGLTALRQLKRELPQVRVVILTSHRADERVREALAAGADCYLIKTAGVEDVVGTVRAAARGQSVLDAGLAQGLRGAAVDGLSPRELDVLRAIGRGRSNKEIASDLGIGEETVKTHVSNVLAKLRLQDRTQAAIFALREGLAPLEG
ncbi:MAG: response regulator transcription factor [Candidatus Dormibacteraeota bacterium]|nr:response regulator transcription factor [Candidatus Dormibacteraeota bacterium]